jgi:hypothetical protein
MARRRGVDIGHAGNRVGLYYDRGVDYDPKIGGPLVALTVFNVDVPAGTDLDR